MRRAAVLVLCVLGVAAPGCGESDRSPGGPGSAETTSGPEGRAAVIEAAIDEASDGGFDPAAGTYTDEAEPHLRRAVSAWNEYVPLDDPDAKRRSRMAIRMVGVFVALEDFPAAARAQQVVIDIYASVSNYSHLALLHYRAGQTREGDLAVEKAVEMAEPDERDALRARIKAAAEKAAAAP